MSQEIVLTKDVSNLLGEIDRLTVNIPDKETARQMVARVIGLEEMLRQMDYYCDVACKMAEAEALLYVRICEQGMLGALKGKRRSVCMWVGGMEAEERSLLVERCRAGATITYLYDNRNNSTRQYEKILTLQRNADFVLEEYKDRGSVVLDTDRMMVGLYECHSNRRAADAERDRVKDRLLRAGAVCVGDGKYVSRNDPRARKALKGMVAQIVTDIRSAAKLAITCDAVDAIEGMCDDASLDDLFSPVAKLVVDEARAVAS